MSGTPQTVTALLRDFSGGNKDALDELLPLVYEELRAVANRYARRQRRDLTLQTTALVHEAYMRLIDQREVQWRDRAHFFAVAATAIRRILIDHFRGRLAAKRGGGRQRVTIEDATVASPGPRLDLLALDEALQRFAKMDPRKARTVELRFFGGLSIEETAEVLAVSHATVERDWNLARAWLYRELGREEGHGDRPLATN